MTKSTPWSPLGDRFLSEGEWAIGQGPDAPDRKLLRRLLVELPDPVSLLEVGCGPGIEVDGLQQAGLLEDITYTGYDFTPELVDRCRERFPRHASFAVRDVHKISDRGPRADVVWARHLLEHVDDGERALRNLWRVAGEVLLVSWFIRPTWRPTDVGCVVADGFQHWTYDARRWISLAGEIGATLYRFDIDHHENRGGVWMLTRRPRPELAVVAHAFLASPEFLAAALPVPPDRHEGEYALLNVLEEARDAVAGLIPVVDRVDDLTRLLADAGKALSDTFEFLNIRKHLDPDVAEVARWVNEAKARVEASFGGPPEAVAEAVQASRDAHARLESALRQHGRTPA